MKRVDLPRRGLESPSDGKRPRILYVEDEVENWDIAYLRLSDRYLMERASADFEAVERIRSFSEYAAILMDIQLKGSQLDGIKLTLLLRGRLEEQHVPSWGRGLQPITTPIIFVTAYGDRHGDGVLQQAGADVVIGKPVNFNKLTLAISNARMKNAMSALDSVNAKVRSS
jgi:CheY-like chemotaxis protein